jgi:hypothetical protein
MNKLLPILILLLLASCASATTLHGTVQDADTGTALSGIYVYVTGGASTYTDSSGKFTLNTPTSGQLNFESESPCYYVESHYHDFPDSEIWRIFRIPTCGSGTNPSINPDPTHPDNGNGEDDNGNGKTPDGMEPTSTGGRIGGAIGFAIVATAVVALLILGGVVTIPAAGITLLGVTFKFAALGALLKFTALAAGIFGYLVMPLLTKLGIPGLSWGSGAVQDLGEDITSTFGVHFNTTDAQSAGGALADAAKEVSDTVVNVVIEGISEATGLSETMTWVLVLGVVAIGLLMWYSQQQQQSMMYTVMSMRDAVTRKKK